MTKDKGKHGDGDADTCRLSNVKHEQDIQVGVREFRQWMVSFQRFCNTQQQFCEDFVGQSRGCGNFTMTSRGKDAT